MRLIVTSDFHLDWFTDGYDRYNDVRSAVSQVLAEVKKDDVFLFLGDLTNPYSRTVHRAASTAVGVAAHLSVRGIQQHWLTGNHDVQDDGIGSHTLMGVQAAELPRCRVHDVPRGCDLFDGDEDRNRIYLITLPYTSLSRTYDPEEFIKSVRESINPKSKVIIAGHLMIDGITPGSETTDMARGRDVYFPLEACKKHFPKALLLNGHYHEAQTFKGIRIPGSLARLTHGEETNKPSFLALEI